jgi:hypothetical protein
VHVRQYILKGHNDILSVQEDNTNMLLLILFFYFTLGFLDVLVKNKVAIETFISKLSGDLSLVFFLIFFYFITGGFFTF